MVQPNTTINTRCFKQLDREERLDLSYYLLHNRRAEKEGLPPLSMRAIAKLLGRCHTTIIRELRRNMNEHGHYVAADAQRAAKRRGLES